MVELTRVPHHRCLTTARVDRIAGQPAEAELEERVGTLLRRAVVTDIGAHAVALHARPLERRDVERVHPSEDAEVVVHHRVTLGVGNAREVGLPRCAVGDEATRLVHPPVHVRHRDAVLLEQLLAEHLVLERKDPREVEALAAYVQLEQLAVALDVDEPHRPPSRLALVAHDRSADVDRQPCGDRLEPCLPHYNASRTSSGVAGRRPSARSRSTTARTTSAFVGTPSSEYG